jgi:hypothetical protein
LLSSQIKQATIDPVVSLFSVEQSWLRGAFHVSQFLFARRFVLGVLLTKISTCRGGRSSLLRPARLAFSGKKAAKEI